MERRHRYRLFLLPSIAIAAMVLNYSWLAGTENVKSIHIVTLIVMGMAIGVLLRNILYFFIDRKK